jgi:putative phage-type endonuclease/ribA/ribD-fused uncharacterized protein
MPVETLDENLTEQATALQANLDHRIQTLLLPLVDERETVSEVYNHHRVAASEEWNAGNKKGWLEHKTLRDEILVGLKEIRAQITEIKDENARIVIQLTKINEAIDKQNGDYHEYTLDTLGPATRTISAPSGSKEWHDQRAKGIGGSDIGAILGKSPFSTREDIFKTKTGQTVPEEKTDNGALFRGDAWEAHIARRFALENPSFRFVHCKDSWKNAVRPHQLGNLDGLIFDDISEAPAAIVEIKTSAAPYSWANGVPAYYRAQVLWYMDNFDIKRAFLAVLIDDHDYRQFEIIPEPGELDHIHEEVDKFVAEVEAYRQAQEQQEKDILEARRELFLSEESISSFKGEYFFLSNFSASPIVINYGGTEYIMPTGEHCFHAMKMAAAKMTEDEKHDWLETMSKAKTPNESKRLGRSIKIDKEKWDRISYGCMTRTQYLKFSQDQDLTEKLKATNPAPLIEGTSWGDRLWGVDENGLGKNQLGEILMDLRSALVDSGTLG